MEGCGTGWMVSESLIEEVMGKTGRWRELGERAQGGNETQVCRLNLGGCD